ncbi:MAG: hypothetical protein RMK74_13210 [Myxococcales bacterium]|nr:hypothetical protein [Myxococcales bacterium]
MQEVRLVVDDKPVEDAEVGRKRRGRVAILLGAGLIVGLLLGYAGGRTMGDRNMFNLALQDGKDLYQHVRTASETINKAKRYIDAATAAARGGPGRPPTVDRQAIEALRALEQPVRAQHFSRKRYSAFQPETVDALFNWFTNTVKLWELFERLNVRTAGQAASRINESCRATQNVVTPSGCALERVEDRILCAMVFVTFPGEGEDPTKVKVRSQITSAQQFDRTLFNGQQDVLESPSKYVILTNPEHSLGVLGAPASECALYQALILEANQLMNETLEAQGRLERGLGDVASLEPLLAF